MSFHWCENIYTTVFTPRDYQVELLAAAYEGNTMICLGHKSSKEFIALKLLQEQAKDMRTTKKVCVYLSCNEAQSMHTMIQHLTDLKVFRQNEGKGKDETSQRLPQDYEVYIMQPSYLFNLLKNRDISLSHVQMLVLEDCHEAYVYQELLPLFKEFYCSSDGVCKMPKILGLAGPLHSASCDLQELSAMLSALEENVCCRTETASDIVTVLRYCSKPIEYIVQCAPYGRNELTAVMEDIICTRIAFLNDHRYDPTEIYNTDEFLEELKDIPDPKKEPLDFLNTILEVLYEMGPWAADRVAFIMFHRIEKQKIKTPHERHYILLCLVNTALFEIRAICEQAFSKYTNHKELIEQYSSPKILRLLEIFRLFKPEEVLTENETMKIINQDLDEMDFQKLTRSLEYSCQSVENIAKQQIESRSIVDNLDPIIQHQPNHLHTATLTHNIQTVKDIHQTSASKSANEFQIKNINATKAKQSRRPSQWRPKRRTGFQRRQNRDNSGDATDTLCALIFCNHNHTARVLFDLLAEMSHHDADLKFLKCQFTSERVADPLTEPKEAEQEHRRQEEVLKRFRMHDCNVLIGTAVLEEGIDLPKCNLVVRWDLPKTYRSYVQCKGRARAVPAYHIILVAPRRNVDTHLLGRLNEQLSDRSHSFLCQNECIVDGTIQDLHNDSDSDSDDNDDIDVNTLNDKALSMQLNKFTIGSAKGIVKILNPEVITNKPPTASEIILKEIKDETLAIEGANTKLSIAEDSNIVCNLNDSNLSTESVFSSISAKNVINDKNFRTDCFEVVDLNDAISKISDKINSSFKSSASSKQSEDLKEKIPVNKNKQKTEEVSISDKDDIKVKLEPDNLKRSEIITNKSKLHERPKLNTYIEKLKMQVAKGNSTQDDLNSMVQTTNTVVDQLAQYREIEKMLLQKCGNSEPVESEHYLADEFTHCIKAYKPKADLLTGASVDLSSAIMLVNKYCSKLPSDTFTKLTPLWRTAKTMRNGLQMFQCTLRLPINSPLKYDIVGLLMPTEALARRMVALQTCKELHICGELDDNLQPIGKEGFKAIEGDWENFELEAKDEKIVQDNLEPRPGTTKRRQYYYKRIASEFCDCRPTAGTPCYLYFLDLTLQCPIPEEQNTRGRKIYPPEDAQQGFGILTLNKIPKVSSFPIFTRSGEVKVSIQLSRDMVVLTDQQILCINTFLNYTFTNVLRLQKFLMIFDPDSTENCVFIVPTTKTVNTNDATNNVNRVIDWGFLDLIEKKSSMMPTPVPEEVRVTQEFDACKFKDAVVMPWYRNQDQPQYFYVAEICPQLTPLSCFPGENYKTFKHYYLLKYNIVIQNAKQPLLDVDHTSARLNFLTPRYVNRKGVALPTSSEETKRAKRENLEQKQILVPELCTVHPFPASLWRTAVCLPCILYRINGLLLADDIRKKVSRDIGLGQQEINDDFDWPMLDFGWSLSEVLRKSRESAMKTTNKTREDIIVENGQKENIILDRDEPKVEIREPCSKKPEKSANEIIIEGEKQLKDSSFIIGTWSNDFPNDIHEKVKSESNDEDDMQYDDDEEEEYLKYVPSNVSFCVDVLENQPKRYASPTFWDFKTTKSNMGSTSNLKRGTGSDSERDSLSASYYDSDSDLASLYGDGFELDDEEEIGPLRRISFKSRNDAETIETEQEIEKRKKQLSIIQDTTENERSYQRTKNLQVGYNFVDLANRNKEELTNSIAKFKISTEQLKKQIKNSGMLVEYNAAFTLPKKNRTKEEKSFDDVMLDTLQTLLPYAQRTDIEKLLNARGDALIIEDMHELNFKFVKEHPKELFTILGCGDIFDRFNDKTNLVITSDQRHSLKQISLNFECSNKGTAHSQLDDNKTPKANEIAYQSNADKISNRFSFDQQPDLIGHPGPSPSIILQALTMSNANDGINLERLETVGDSFLKYAITTYLYITYDNVHEGKLSHLRSKQVANLNLYRLGRRKMLGEYMIATKFEPHDNWLPPCYYVPKELEKALIEAKIPPHYWKLVDLPNIRKLSNEEICKLVREKGDSLGLQPDKWSKQTVVWKDDNSVDESEPDFTWFIPYNLVTQHSIPDKSVADCVEALIGAYLIECGSRGALLFMAWLGIRVLPYVRKPYDPNETRQPGSTNPDAEDMITVFGEWTAPKSPLLHYSPNASEELEILLTGFDKFEATLGYKFRDRSYLLQAMTHASYSPNRLTDCYQRLEFLGDAVLDYLITRHLYEDPRQHSPGALTDLRSALVNNTIFASLAVRHGFHKYFRHLSPGLNEVIDRFVRIQNENGHSISEEYYLLSEEECDDAEDVEVPKALGDVFESVAGAIFLDSNMSLDVVWQVYSNMMKPEIDQFSNSVPKSPIRELLELEPETAKFGKPEKLADGRRVRVTVDVFWKGTFRGVGRNYRIAKCTAAKCALRQLKKKV